MSSDLVVIADVLAHQPFEMPFIPYDHMIKQVSSETVNPALGDSILPWTADSGSLRYDSEGLRCFDNFVVNICDAIKDQVIEGLSRKEMPLSAVALTTQ
jgi:hypothetical protein